MAVTEAPARAEKLTFFVVMGWVFVAIAFLGFIPTYWVRLAEGSFSGRPILHIHGMLMFAWVLLYAVQTHLAARGRIADHRAWGMAGIALISLISFSVVVAAINSIKVAEAMGKGDDARAFSIVSLTGIVVIVTLVALAIRNVHRPDWHKRLMTLSFVPLLEAPAARPFAAVMAPPDAGPPPVFVTIFPSLVVGLIIVAMLVYDRRRLGRFHPATMYAGTAIVAVQILCIPVSTTPAWMAVARWVESLAG